METRGNVGTYVAGSTSLDLRPVTPSRRAPKASCADCRLPLARPGAWHICLDLSAPEPVIVKVAPKPKPNKAAKTQARKFVPRAELDAAELERRRARDREYKRSLRQKCRCVNGCGAIVSRSGVACMTCVAAARRGLTPEQEAEVVRLYVDEQWPSTKIGRRIGVATNVILHALERNGVPRRSLGRKRRAA